MYPILEINIDKLKENAKAILDICKDSNIDYCFLVTKILAGDINIVKNIYGLGFSHLADSRILNLKKYKDIQIDKVLLRVPMLSELSQVIKYADISLQSELKTISILDKKAEKQNKTHKIILMFDLGDLREGIYYKHNYLSIVKSILELSNIEIYGIGTNLTCFGAIIPEKEHLEELITIKNTIEKEFKLNIPLISAGNSSIIYLLDKDMPKEINNIRIGEAIYLGHETSFHQNIKTMQQDVFKLKAELIEVKTKPSVPKGKRGLNAFGKIILNEDQGLMKRGILALGKQDVNEADIIACDENISILGSSSDHLIVNLTNTNYKIGDIIDFKLNYSSLLRLMSSTYVKKKYIFKKTS